MKKEEYDLRIDKLPNRPTYELRFKLPKITIKRLVLKEMKKNYPNYLEIQRIRKVLQNFDKRLRRLEAKK